MSGKDDGLEGAIITSGEARAFLGMVTDGFYGRSRTALWVFEAIGREWDELRAWAEGMRDEISPRTCTWSVGIWEWAYGISTDETLPLAERRQRVMAAACATLPLNPETVRRGVAALAGADVSAVEVRDPIGPYAFGIRLRDHEPAAPWRDILRYVAAVKPAHLRALLTAELGLEFCQRGTESLSARLSARTPMPFWGAALLDGTERLDGGRELGASRAYGMAARATARVPMRGKAERARSGRIVVTRDLSFLDGRDVLCGCRKLDAIYREEEI